MITILIGVVLIIAIIIVYMTVKQLAEKTEALQASVNESQKQITQRITQLEATVAQLKIDVANGGTPEELQAISDRLDAIKAVVDNSLLVE